MGRTGHDMGWGGEGRERGKGREREERGYTPKLQFLASPLVTIFVLGLVCLVLASGSILRVF